MGSLSADVPGGQGVQVSGHGGVTTRRQPGRSAWEAADVRDRFRRGDRVALENTVDPHTRLRPGDEGTVTRHDPGPGQLDVCWDSGSTLSMLLNDGDRVRLITPAPGAGPAGNGKETGR
jgi:hypothetical protein